MSYYDNSKELDQIADLQATIADLQGQLEVAQNKQTALEKSVRNLTEFYDKYNGTPCEQIRHQQEVELLQQRVAQLEGERLGMMFQRRGLFVTQLEDFLRNTGIKVNCPCCSVKKR